ESCATRLEHRLELAIDLATWDENEAKGPAIAIAYQRRFKILVEQHSYPPSVLDSDDMVDPNDSGLQPPRARRLTPQGLRTHFTPIGCKTRSGLYESW